MSWNGCTGRVRIDSAVRSSSSISLAIRASPPGRAMISLGLMKTGEFCTVRPSV